MPHDSDPCQGRVIRHILTDLLSKALSTGINAVERLQSNAVLLSDT